MAPTCTTPAAAPIPPTDSTSIACRPPGCVPLPNSRLQPCVRPGTRRTPFQQWQHPRCSIAVVCTQDRTTREPPLVPHFVDRFCFRRRRPKHQAPHDPPAPFPPGEIPSPSLEERDPRELLGGRAHAGVCQTNLGSSCSCSGCRHRKKFGRKLWFREVGGVNRAM